MAFFKKEKEAAKASPGKAALSLTQGQLNRIRDLFGGKNISTAEELLEAIKRSQTVRFGGNIEVTLTTDNLWDLQQQALGMGVPYEQYVKEFVEDCISLQLEGVYKYGRY